MLTIIITDGPFLKNSPGAEPVKLIKRNAVHMGILVFILIPADS